MRVPALALVACLFTTTTSAVSAFVAPTFVTKSTSIRTTATSSSLASLSPPKDLSEFDFLLNEDGTNEDNTHKSHSRRLRMMGKINKIQIASSVAAAAPAITTDEDFLVDTEDFASADSDLGQPLDDDEEEDEYANFEDTKLVQYQQTKNENPAIEWLKKADFQEIAWTLVIPGMAATWAARWLLRKANTQATGNAEEGLASFANEMIYYDGDYEEMKKCKQSWDTTLMWLGPGKKKRMLNEYLEAFSKRMPVSPQAISSLSYAFEIFNLDEEDAAEALVDYCEQGGEETLASAAKLLFFGNRIFESDEAKDILSDIGEIVQGSYRGEEGAEQIVEASQMVMAEAAYRSEVQKAKDHESLPSGWQILGLEPEAAMRIYKEEKKGGFKSDLEKKFEYHNTKYDNKGRRMDKDGNLIDEEDIEEALKEAEEPQDSGMDSSSNAFECGNCGYTLFVAEGRNEKFFGAGFQCPECGASKDDFSPVDLSE